MKKAVRVLVLFLVLAIVLSFATTAFAANECSMIRGNSGATKTFYVQTDNTWRIGSDYVKITQTKGTMSYYNIWSNKVYKDMYGVYTAEIYNMTTKKYEKSKKISGASDKITLDRNCKYRIRIIPYTSSELQLMNVLNIITLKSSFEWTKNATWTVTKTRGVMTCV